MVVGWVMVTVPVLAPALAVTVTVVVKPDSDTTIVVGSGW
jgi:acyl-CoA reductase-like NAD-dependent aldehyde dehydrogenase